MKTPLHQYFYGFLAQAAHLKPRTAQFRIMRENVCRAELHNTWNRLLQFVITFYQFYLIEISQVNWLRIFLGEIKYIRLTSVDRRPACFETIHRNCWYHQAKHESWQRWMLSFTNLRNVKRDTKNVKLGYMTFWTACQRTGNEDSNFLYCNVKRWLHFLSIMIKICEHIVILPNNNRFSGRHVKIL